MKGHVARPLAVVAALFYLSGPANATQLPSGAEARIWGLDTLAAVQKHFASKGSGLYADQFEPGRPPSARPAFMWGCGVMLSALASAAAADRTRGDALLRYAHALDAYWTDANGIRGYDVLPAPKPSDRYYDDNEWVVLALLDGYEATGDHWLLQRAKEAFRFVMSGEDSAIGGGIYWRENERSSKNCCSNAPAAAAALRLYLTTRDRRYLTIGRRLVDWTVLHLQDTDGLFCDNENVNGKLDHTKWSYNSALMIRAYCLLFQATQDKRNLAEAERIGRAAMARWVRPESGGIADGAAFAHLLLGALDKLYDADGDPVWRSTVARALEFLHDKARDADGLYGENWAQPAGDPARKTSLLTQASAARAFLEYNLTQPSPDRAAAPHSPAG